MKILNRTFNFFCKFKTKNSLPSVNSHRFRFKRVLSPEIHSSCIVSAYRCMTVNSNTSGADVSLRNGGKYFQETENEYAHEVMENLPDYSMSLLMHPLKVDKYYVKTELSDNLNAIQKFIKTTLDNIKHGSCLENEMFTDTVQNVCSSLPQASDEEIKMILHYLCLWPPTSSTMTPNFSNLWNMLDKECVKRIKRWNATQQLLIADYWFHLRLSRICRYNQEKNSAKKFSNMSNGNSHLIFVYGTLKKGEPNHDLIEHRTEGEATFVGNAKTVKTWPLVIASRYNIPFLLYCEGKGENVSGEIYEVDDVMLAKFDELECHPNYYTRLTEEVQIMAESGGKILKPWIYFLKNFRPELLNLPFLSHYSSKGSHGLEYVSRYKRPPDGSNYILDVKNL